MIVGVLRVRLHLQDVRSLKDKRRIVRSLKDRLRHDFNVSVSEVESQDNHAIAVLGLAQVGSDTRYINGALDKALKVVRSTPGAFLIDYDLEFL
jgi:uncharacterized protein YlxP (DUF503 family)